MLDERELARIAQDKTAVMASSGAEDFRAVAPPVMSFAAGRRR